MEDFGWRRRAPSCDDVNQMRNHLLRDVADHVYEVQLGAMVDGCWSSPYRRAQNPDDMLSER
jgi:hypothetical protein